MNRYKQWILAVCALLLVGGLGSGCALIRKGAAKMISPMATQLSDGLMHQNDMELVRDGAPAFLLMLDALAEKNPDNTAVLLAAADAQMAYATGFVDKSNKKRTKIMYLKAKTYGLRALSKNKRFAKAMDAPLDDFVSSLRSFWVMWIIASSDSPAALGEMPRALAMMERVQELDPEIREGGVDLFYGIYFTVLPLGGGRDLEKAKAHFERAIEIAGSDYLLARVTFAEFYARYAFDQALFEATLNEVLAAEPDTPEYTLMNTVAQMRAQGLLDKTDDLF